MSPMKIAIFYKRNKLCRLSESNVNVTIFDQESESVNGVKSLFFEENSVKNALLFLSNESIDMIYVSEIDDETGNRIREDGIAIKTAHMLLQDKLFNTLSLSCGKCD